VARLKTRFESSLPARASTSATGASSSATRSYRPSRPSGHLTDRRDVGWRLAPARRAAADFWAGSATCSTNRLRSRR